jgi:uncharacterized protein YndB with AHSA1/START domain
MKTLPVIRHTFLLDTPIENVWKAVATSEGLEAWLMPNNFQPVIGGRFHFQSEPMGRWDGVVPCLVLDLKKPHLLRLNWMIANEFETTLSFQLEETGKDKNGTELTITHSGWENVPFEFAGLRQVLDQGWGKHIIESLQEYLKQVGEK